MSSVTVSSFSEQRANSRSLVGSATAWARELLEQLEVDPARMLANIRLLAEAGVAEASPPETHLGAAAELIDRALAAHAR